MSHNAVVTCWFVNVAHPEDVLEGEPKADRGFGRKLLAQVNPAWPITPIGQFPLNRSSVPGVDEYYIAGYPGVAVVRFFVRDAERISETAKALRTALPSADTYVYAEGTDSDYAAIAHYQGETLRRAFSATRDHVFEDVGLPDPFEAPYWAGETAPQLGGISLPFEPPALMREAERAWLGIEVGEGGPDVHIIGYAVDGRPEPKVEAPAPRTKTVNEVAAKFAEQTNTYDDYEQHDEEAERDEFSELADASVAAAKRVGRGLRRRARDLKATIAEKIRHADRG